MATVMGTTSASNVIDVDVYARGEDGRGVSSTTFEYQASDSGTTVPSGTWSTDIVTPEQGQYLWTRTTYTYNDGTILTSYNVSYYSIDGEKGDTGPYYTPVKTEDTSTGAINLTFTPSDSSLEDIDFGNIKGDAGGVKFQYVGAKSALPTSDIDTATFYFVNTSYAVSSEKYYDAYLYVNSHWELIGNDLTNYVTKSALESALNDFKAQLIVINAAAADTTYYLTGVEEESGNENIHSTGITYSKATDADEGVARVDGAKITTELFFSID